MVRILALLLLALPASGASRYFADRAGAPVQWQAWGDAAFARAKKEGRPIFLSIGFASSDECYRMHREAFLSGENAETLNVQFVPVLLDRVEHPEVAEAYEAAARTAVSVDGSPVNLVLNARLEPFAAAGFMKSDELARFLVINANKYREGAAPFVIDARLKPAAPPDVENVVDAIAKTYDATNGGFGFGTTGPRHPQPMTISFLLRYAARAKHEGIRSVAIDTLKKLAIAPVRDQLGGGFHRATQDVAWRQPYFEKMLPDQALLAMAYLDAWHATGEEELRYVARTTLDYALRDLRGGGKGAFDASQDAYNFVPMQGPELINAKFYLWNKDEILRLVGPEAAAKVFKIYDLKDGVLNLPALAEWRFLGETHVETNAELQAPLAKMLDVRQKRPEPSREFNVIAGWNGLMISALARAGAVLGDRTYIDAAMSAASSIATTHWNARSKTLLRSPGVDALAEDYAMLVQGFLDLFDASYDVRWLELAIALQQRQDQLFWDAGAGAYATGATAAAPVRVLIRETDDETPSANAVAAQNLLRLAALTGNETWRTRPTTIFESFGGRMRTAGAEQAQMAHSMELARIAPKIVVVTGDPRKKQTFELLLSYAQKPEPMRALIFLPAKGAARDKVVRALPFTGALVPNEEMAIAYLCANGECKKQ
ncbi:MAG TPA: DUF255 domain-containing protein [Thermoanaerobaculia bacterium]|nr:DUF255 domain-containing protein [Thermoanaerobaculia bacterium]